jgi:hypothetical protein
VITWNSVAGQTYRLQYKNTLGGTNWYDVLPDIVATGPTTTLTNALGGATQRFYRVIAAPTEVPPCVITSVRVTNGIAVITWNSIAGQTYRVQYKNRLTDNGWQDLPPDIVATGLTTTVTDALGGATQRFYRVIAAPTVTPPCVITSVRVTNGIAVITWNSVASQTYRVQYKDRLTDNDWLDAGPAVLATNSTTTVTIVIGSAPQRFYRVTLIPGGVKPVIRSISMTNGVVTVVWSSVLNQRYLLQHQESLSETVWHDIGPEVTAIGGTTAITDTVGNLARRYYRVALRP